ncbi:MAG TPA: prepilin peptidase, partial [Myxococcota bacterium]|nr:prepilin peptidase [Myxococcota bacterium]
MDVALSVPDRVWIGLALLFGIIIGSFLNVVIHRLPRDESISRPSSHCVICHAPVRWYDNLPLLSYLWLGGRCRGCGARISLRYPIIELLTGVLFAA